MGDATGEGSISDDQLASEIASLGAEKAPEVEAAPAVEAEAEEPTEVEPEAHAEDAEPDEDDPKVARGMEQVRRAEQRWRAEAERKEQELSARESKLAERLQAADRTDALIKRFRIDPVAAVKAMGLTDDQFEDLSLAFYADSPKGRTDPKYKARAEQTARERALAEETADLRRRLDEREKQEAEAKARAEEQKHVAKYVDGLAKAATAKTAPITASLLTKRPERTRRDLLRVAGELYAEHGEQPSPTAVLKAYEAELVELGITAPQVQATKAAPKAAAKPATPSVRVTDDDLASEIASGKFH
jgi:hypothetical protein